MRIFHGRPLAFAACAAAAVAVLTRTWSGGWKLMLLAAVLALGVGLCLVSLLRHRLGGIRISAILSCAMTACVLLSSWLWQVPRSERYFSVPDAETAAAGYVEERLQSGTVSSRFRVRLTEFDGERVRDTLLLECGYRSALQEGDCFRLTGKIREFRDTDIYNEEESLTGDGVVAVLVSASYADLDVTGQTDTPELALRRMNRRLCERLREAIGGEPGALACAVLLGNRSFLSGATTLAFRRTGVSHLLALSGLHVSILIGILEWILRRLRAPKLLRVAAVPPIAVFYLFLTGAAVSTIRAVLMVTVLSLAFLSAERYDSFTALCASLVFILIVTPYAAADLSLWLSFCAAAAIIVFLPALSGALSDRRWGRLPKPIAKGARGILTAVATGLFACNGVLPISALALGSVSVWSVPLTLILSPLMTAALFLGILTLLFPVQPVAFLAGLPLRGILLLTSEAAKAEHVLFCPTQPGERALVVLVLILTAAAAIFPLRRKGLVAVPVAVSAVFLLTGFLGVFLPQTVNATYTHASAGETLILTEGRDSAVLDMTDGSVGTVARTAAVLKQAGCCEIDDWILTHYHSQTVALLRRMSGSVCVRCVRLPVPTDDFEQAVAAVLEEEAERLGIRIRYDTSGLSMLDAEVIRMERDRTSGVEASVDLTVRAGRMTLTALSGQLIGSDRWQEVYPHLEGSDLLIVLSHGRTDRREQTIRLPECVQGIVWADAELAERHPAVKNPPRVWIGEETVVLPIP